MTNLICNIVVSQLIDSTVNCLSHERIIRIIKLVELKQNGRCISCKKPITKDHAVVTRGRPRSYYHKDCAIKHNII
jgi:hypothetical protein